MARDLPAARAATVVEPWSCGEAVVSLAISVSNSCAVLNYFPLLNDLPSWPGCIPVTITGDIVRRAEAGCPATAEP